MSNIKMKRPHGVKLHTLRILHRTNLQPRAQLSLIHIQCHTSTSSHLSARSTVQKHNGLTITPCPAKPSCATHSRHHMETDSDTVHSWMASSSLKIYPELKSHSRSPSWRALPLLRPRSRSKPNSATRNPTCQATSSPK